MMTTCPQRKEDKPMKQPIKNNVSWIGKIDYVIANHAEHDHSCALSELMGRIPRAAYCRTG
jgi:flavorubredoxin